MYFLSFSPFQYILNRILDLPSSTSSLAGMYGRKVLPPQGDFTQLRRGTMNKGGKWSAQRKSLIANHIPARMSKG